MSSAIFTPPHSSSAPASMETLLAMIGRVVAKFEARLEAQERRRATAFPPSRSEFDLPFGRPRTSWDLPEPPQKPAYSESYGGGDGYSNNYNDYHNNEPQAWFYNTYEPPPPAQYYTYEPDRYNHVPHPVQYEPPPPVQYYTYESDRYNYVSQPVQYEPPPSAQYYSVVEPPQQSQSYYPQPPPNEVRPSLGFWQPSLAPPQQLLPTPLAPWEVASPKEFTCLEPMRIPPSTNGKLEPVKVEASNDSFLLRKDERGTADINQGCGKLGSAEEEVSNDLVVLEYADRGPSDGKVTLLKVEATSDSILEYDDGGSSKQQRKRKVKSKGAVTSSWGVLIPTATVMGVIIIGHHGHKKRKRYVLREMAREDVFLKVWRLVVVFGIYALEEVYKDLLNLHLEDKVIFKGGGVDTSRF